MAERHIYVLLTKYPDTLSKAVSGFSLGYYSHVSIGFEEDCSTFYSFTIKGFRIESPARICTKRKDVPCILYRLQVSQKTYDSMRRHVDAYVDSATKWKFNLIGLGLSMVRIPFLHRRNHRFCSQFVAEILEKENVVKLSKRGSTMLPKDFLKVGELNQAFKGTLNNLVLEGI